MKNGRLNRFGRWKFPAHTEIILQGPVHESTFFSISRLHRCHGQIMSKFRLLLAYSRSARHSLRVEDLMCIIVLILQ